MDLEHKEVRAELKELNDKGEGVLRFIRFDQEDKDGDITRPGFIGRQKAVLLASHNWKSDHPPLGHGESYEADGATNFRFRLNMQDERAKSWHSWLKMDRGVGLQQVSYGFSPYTDAVEKWQKDGRSGRYLNPRKDASPGAKLHEVSFVVVGSGNDTAILDIKSTDALLSDPVMAGGGPMKESRSMEQEDPIVEPQEAKAQDADGAEPIEDYTQYPEDRRPPLSVMIKWLRLYRYHIPFIRDIRKKDGKEINPETIREFSDLVQEVVEVATLLNIKVMTSHLMPDVEADARRREWYNTRLQELSAEANAEEAKKLQQLQAAALDLEAKTRERARAMKYMFQDPPSV